MLRMFDVNYYSKLCWLILFCYEISPLLQELPPCGQVQVIVFSVQLLREWPCLTVSSRSLWYVTGWGHQICMFHSFTWLFMLCCKNETNFWDNFYGACVPNVSWILSMIPAAKFEVIWLNYYLSIIGLSYMWYPVAMFAYSDKRFYEIFMPGKRGVTPRPEVVSNKVLCCQYSCGRCTSLTQIWAWDWTWWSGSKPLDQL